MVISISIQSDVPHLAAAGGATLTVAAVSGQPGQQVQLPVSVDTGGVAISGLQVNLDYDGATLSSPVGAAGPLLPESWTFLSNSPAPGDMRFLAVDLSGEGQALNGVVFIVAFNISADATAGVVPVNVALVNMQAGAEVALDVTANGGGVTVMVNQPPTVEAGQDATVTLASPATVFLDGTVADDGLSAGPLTMEWTQISGPGPVTFGDAFNEDTTATFIEPGLYDLRLNADDGEFSAHDDVTITVNPPPAAPNKLYFSLLKAGAVGGKGLKAGKEDIVAFDGTDFSLHFDGSDVGLAGFGLDAFALISNSEILFSLSRAEVIPGISGIVDDSDIVKFTATSLGESTSGFFELYFDGSDVGLTKRAEGVDAIELLDNGRILVSTSGSFSVPGVSGKDEDIIEFNPSSLGSNTAGSWSFYLDGSDVGLGGRKDDVNALAMDSQGAIYLSTADNFSVVGVNGADEDVFVFRPRSLGSVTEGAFDSTRFFDGSKYGLSRNDVSGFDIP